MAKGAKSLITNSRSAKPLPVPDFSPHSRPAAKIPGGGLNAKAPDHFEDRNLNKASAEDNQFAPTPADPYRAHKRMAGMEN